MANGIRGKVYYIDSGGLSLDNIKMKINCIALAANNTTGLIELSLTSNTANVIYKQSSPDNNPVTISTFFGGWWNEDRLFVRTLTAGTGFIYFS